MKLTKKIRIISKSIGEAVVQTINHDGVEHAGYMAFMGLLSLFPFLILFVAFAGQVGQLEIGKEFVTLLLANIPNNISTAIEPRIIEIISGPPPSLLNIAIIGGIWTASSSVEGIRTILNRVYRVSTPPAYIWRRLLSIVQLIIFTVVIIVSMFFLIAFPVIIDKLSDILPEKLNLDPLWFYIKYPVIVIALFFGISGIYYLIPNVRLKFITVVPGAVIVVFLWICSGNLLSAYFSHFKQLSLIYGSLGSIVVCLLFFYLLSLIFIFGAELNYLLCKRGKH